MNDDNIPAMQPVGPSELQDVEGGGEYAEKFLSILLTLFPLPPSIINV